MADEDPITQELRLDQLEREREERRSATRALAPDAAEQHARRAEKAGYLRAKLEQRARAERRFERPEDGR
jgi:hypothetical protein